jgi:dynein light chain roadblock-type
MEYDLIKGFGEEFETVIKRISTHNGVIGVIVTQDSGQPIYTTMDNNKTYLFSNKLAEFSQMARSAIRQVNPEDDLEVVRIKTSKYEIMAATPTLDHSIITVQQYQPYVDINS